jgi:hypothetical protein
MDEAHLKVYTITDLAEHDGFRRDAERYRMLRDNGYLDALVGDLHPCDEAKRTEMTDAQVDRFAALHAPAEAST